MLVFDAKKKCINILYLEFCIFVKTMLFLQYFLQNCSLVQLIMFKALSSRVWVFIFE